MGLVQIGLGVLIVVYNGYAVLAFDELYSLVKTMAFVNGCSDAQTHVDQIKYTRMIAE